MCDSQMVLLEDVNCNRLSKNAPASNRVPLSAVKVSFKGRFLAAISLLFLSVPTGCHKLR